MELHVSRGEHAPHSVVEIQCLAKTYRDYWGRRVEALKEVSLEISRGEIFGLLGPNGAGKTTTFSILLGLQRPTKGEGRLFNSPLGDVDCRRRLGYLPENPYFYDYLNPYELLDMFADLSGVPQNERRRRIHEVLDLVGISVHEKRRLRKFSKGMRQRVGMAQAILHKPELLILDEPMSGLDPVGRRHFRDIISHMGDQGTTVLFASHVLSDVEALCSRVGILVDGKLRRVGTVDELVNPGEGQFEVVLMEVPDSLVMEWSDQHKVKRSGGRVLVSAESNAVVQQIVQQAFARGGSLVAVRPNHATLEDEFMQEVQRYQESKSKEGEAAA